jgi:hypothetical protein
MIFADYLKPGQSEIEYLLSLFNSATIHHSYGALGHETGRVFAQVKLSKMEQLPIGAIDFTNPIEKAQHDNIVALVERAAGR